MPPVTVRIFGEDYTIRSKDDPAYVQRVAAYLDGKMREVAEAGGVVSSSKVAILAGLNIADEYFRQKEARREDEEAVNRALAELIGVLGRCLGD